MKLLSLLKILTPVLFALLAGTIIGSLFFSDLATGETILTRTLIASTIAANTSLITGYLLNRRWWLSILNVWLLLIFFILAVISLLSGQGDINEIFLILLPILLSFAGGFAGYKLAKIQPFKY